MKDYVFALVNNGQTTGLVEDEFRNLPMRCNGRTTAWGFIAAIPCGSMKGIGMVFRPVLNPSKFLRPNGCADAKRHRRRKTFPSLFVRLYDKGHYHR